MVRTKKIGIGLGLILLTGCGDIKQKIGLQKVPPKDLSVDPYPRGLEVPPDFALVPQEKGTVNIPKKTDKTQEPTAAEKELISKFSREGKP